LTDEKKSGEFQLNDSFYCVITGQKTKKVYFAAWIYFFKWQFKKHLHFQLSTFNSQFCLHPGKMNAGSSLTVCAGCLDPIQAAVFGLFWANV
jgi:hypothetical protein